MTRPRPDETGGSIPPEGQRPARGWQVSLSELLRRGRHSTPPRGLGDPVAATSNVHGGLTGHLALSHPESELGSGWTLRVHPSQVERVPPRLLSGGLYHLREGDHLRVFEAPRGHDGHEPVWEGTVHLAPDPHPTESPSGAADVEGLQSVHVGVSGHQWIRWFLSGAAAEVERATDGKTR